ncbi:hypothetical protein EYF80_032189 [Liparis tanakae]|uniref:Uncharacterized protein n=1 Tax=Liparis tanakae TaxID=230148 RepID=A0A4Z2GVC5_9TELE|nr:hypothetical protein EYF80_032189 [Liparis tanakae]
MVAISFSDSADFSRGLILKYIFIHGQFLTLMKARTFHWITNPNAFQHTVTAQLVHDERILHRPRNLALVGNEAAYKVGALTTD